MWPRAAPRWPRCCEPLAGCDAVGAVRPFPRDRDPARLPMPRASVLTLSLFVALASWVVLVLAYASFWRHLYPRGDEFALIEASQRASTEWLTQGFDRYFIAYPEWTVPYTAYLRPVVNAVYWAFSPWSEPLFRAQLLVANYGVHAANAGLVFAMVAGTLAAPQGRAWLAAGAVFCSVAFFASAMPLQPAFAMDGLAAFAGLLAIWLAAAGRTSVALLLFALALLTKESALPVGAALMLYGGHRRQWRLALGVGALLLLWVGLRWYAFGGFGPVHSLSRPFQPMWVLVDGWAGARHLQLPSGGWRELVAPAMLLALIGLLVLSLPALKLALSSGEPRPAGRAQGLAELLGWAVLSSALYLAATDTHPRFTYVFGVLLVPLLASDGRRLARGLLRLLLLTGAIAAVYSWTRIDSAAQATHQQAARALVQSLASLPAEGPPIYIVNDHVGGYASATSMQRFAGLQRPVVRVNSVQLRCSHGEEKELQMRVARGGPTVVEVVVPSCVQFIFEGAVMSGEAFDSDGHIERNTKLRYTFAEVDRTSASTAARPDRLRLGTRMRVQIDGPATLLSFDQSEQRWRVW